jgi:tRNA threonylcarbamoyladenosine biosynthesis protein TsaB
MNKLLAFDTATEHLSVALAWGDQLWTHEGEGGAAASATLIPAVMGLLDGAGLRLRELDGLAFGCGPGAFTGLRTASSVAQGLAFGASLPVLPIETLLAVAEEARQSEPACDVWAVIDARMGEIYAAHYRHDDGVWSTVRAPCLLTPDTLNRYWCDAPPQRVAGSALRVHAETLNPGAAHCLPEARPRARAMVPLARALLRRDAAVTAAQALPLYLRDKVAQTLEERAALKAGVGS